MDNYLAKPVQKQELLKTIEETVKDLKRMNQSKA
jgi:YesN/AraC family two-component response regulator